MTARTTTSSTEHCPLSNSSRSRSGRIDTHSSTESEVCVEVCHAIESSFESDRAFGFI